MIIFLVMLSATSDLVCMSLELASILGELKGIMKLWIYNVLVQGLVFFAENSHCDASHVLHLSLHRRQSCGFGWSRPSHFGLWGVAKYYHVVTSHVLHLTLHRSEQKKDKFAHNIKKNVAVNVFKKVIRKLWGK